jgi:DNA polymerase I-like protein with 3'-5' exonuclease and polymerase domains
MRIIIVDKIATTTQFYGLGLSDVFITSVESLMQESDGGRSKLVLGPGDTAMVVGGDAFNYLRQFYHFGVRNENYYDCAKLYRLSIEGGAFIKVLAQPPRDKEELNKVFSEWYDPNFTKEITYNFKHKVLHTYEDVNKFMRWLEKLPPDTEFGADFEASGMPLDIQYEISGLSICTDSMGGFISFTDLRHLNQPVKYSNLIKRIAEWVMKHQDKIWVFNQQYEFQAFHRMFRIIPYNLCDAGVINVIDGYHLDKKYSLKWTAQRVLMASVWDSEFDRISDLVRKMLFEEVPDGKSKTKTIFQFKQNVTQQNFTQTPEFQELIHRYPKYENEFIQLILEYWGNEFMVIPSDILGYYCNLDSFYTLMIAKIGRKNYSEDCVRTFLDNSRLGCLLHSSGLYINEPLRLRYREESIKEMAWGITYCATARCMVNMKILENNLYNFKRLHPIVKNLLETGRFYEGDLLEITKDLILSNIDHSDCYPFGIDEGCLLLNYGKLDKDFPGYFMEFITSAMKECKMIKTPRATKANPNPQEIIVAKIDDGIKTKKKLIGLVADKLLVYLGLDKIKTDSTKFRNLETYLKYKGVYEMFQDITRNQLYDRNNMPETILYKGRMLNLLDYSTEVSNDYFKCKSPQENNQIILEMASTFFEESCYLAGLSVSTHNLNGEESFYKNLNIKTPQDAFNHFKNEMNEWVNGNKNYPYTYPEELFQTVNTFADEYKKGYFAKEEQGKEKDPKKSVWDDFNGFNTQQQFFKYIGDEYKQYGEPFKESDMDERMFFMRKLNINYLRYKKYSKVLSTYIDGMFKNQIRWVIEDKFHIPIRYADPKEPGAVAKCMVHYEVNMKKTKRWSSNFHTIISHADFKDLITTPPPFYYDLETGQLVRGKDCVETYYDISSAEVKSAGFASGDPKLIEKFVNGEDIYIYTAKLYLGEAKWDSLDKGAKKTWRKKFKTVFLGVLYGLGKTTLAGKLHCSVDEALKIIESLYNAFQQLRVYVSGQQDYPLSHDGFVNTMLGDKLQANIWESYKYSKLPSEKRQLEQAIKRLGVNMPIQGGTSVIMASGFFNTIRKSFEDEWELPLQPIIVVHDSNTNYVPVDHLFEISEFYDKYFTEYCASYGPKIVLLFDLLAGTGYESAMPMKVIDKSTLEFSGSAYQILSLYDRLMNSPDIKVEANMKREDLVNNWIEDPVQRFIMEKGVCVWKDTSNYTIQFHKIS